MKPPFRRPSRATHNPAQLQFEFMRTTPLQLSPTAQRKAYDEHWLSIKGEPRHRNHKQERKAHGTRQKA
jgi:hypothetical protein